MILKKEDFKIYEDNIPQNIVTFSAEKVAIGPAAAVADQESGKTGGAGQSEASARL